MPALAAAAATVELEPQELASKPARLPFNVLFTDLDGTCVHYGIPLEEINRDGSGEMLLLPPSTTGPHGVISVRTLQVGGCWDAALRSVPAGPQPRMRQD
jgi:hypothetical protein